MTASLSPCLIESILLEIPIPPVYFGKRTGGGSLEVIDGQQRLTAIIRFIRNEYSLQKLQRLSNLNGLRFKDLREQQDKLLDAPIRSIVIDAGGNEQLRYEVFERLNRGSVALTEQELRNCVYRGSFNELLGELVNDPIWRKLKGGDEEPRFIEREMILRFFALSKRIDSYTGNLKRFLNDFMAQHAPADPDTLEFYRANFRQAMTNVYTVFGEQSAHLYGPVQPESTSGCWYPKFSVSALDIQSAALQNYPTSKIQNYADKIREAYIDYLTSNQQVKAATTSTNATKVRWSGFKLLVQHLLESKDAELRLFPQELRVALFRDKPVCALCLNKIHTLEDSVLDHIRPFSKGGKTEPSNAQLAHRLCNGKKSAKSIDEGC